MSVHISIHGPVPARPRHGLRRRRLLYLAAMDKSRNNPAVEAELKRLESRLEELVALCNQLREENRSLRDSQEHLVAERAGLLHKNEEVKSRVEAMISRLRSLEDA